VLPYRGAKVIPGSPLDTVSPVWLFGIGALISVLVAAALPGGKSYALSMTVLVVIAVIGLVLALLIPREQAGATAQETGATARAA
jgi:hypothetical protein